MFDVVLVGWLYMVEECEWFVVFMGVEGEDVMMVVFMLLYVCYGFDGCGYFGEIKVDLNLFDMLCLLIINVLY